jgi:uncharacterized protein (DUF302 family)
MTNAAEADQGIARIPSHYSVSETITRLQALLQARGIKVFALIDFSGDAERAGLTMRPEQMLIFGNPKAGTPLMVAAPTTGLDLPLKALVWQDGDGNTWITYNEPRYVVKRHGLASSFSANLAAVEPILESAAHD